MCGVAALFAYHYASPPADIGELRRIRDSMAPRGPDGTGEWVSSDGRVALGHRRLAVIDLSEKAAQPMRSADGSTVVSFNGEIYNYRRLRSDLEARGCSFQTSSDTEVLLNLYLAKKEALFEDLRGMYAFALWDAKTGRLLLGRDPYGIKPLYYFDDGWTIRVASQVKAILCGGRASKEIEPAGAAGFFLMGSVPEPFTIYRDIRSVPAGSFIVVDESGPSAPQGHFSIARIFLEANSSPAPGASLQGAVCEALVDSVRQHLTADVPVGLFLSGGIDSGSVAGLAHDAGAKDMRSVTLAFEEYAGDPLDEGPWARQVSTIYRTDHHAKLMRLAELKADLPRFFGAMDQPTIDGVNTYFISKAAAEAGLKVALSGLGGDELFGGYPSFHEIPALVRAMAVPSKLPLAGDVFGWLCRASGGFYPSASPKVAGLVKYGGSFPGAYFLRRGLFMPWELDQVMDRPLAREGLRRLNLLRRIGEALAPDPRTPFSRVASLEASWYLRNQLLRDADWAGMAHSLEIRTPLVDSFLLKRLARCLISMNGAGGKPLLAGSLTKPLPPELIQKKKTGFTVPLDRWLESDPALDDWKRIPALRKENCHWSRRWAYTVYRRMAA